MSKKFKQLVAKCIKNNTEILSELTGCECDDSPDAVEIIKNWHMAVGRIGKMPVYRISDDDGFDLLGLVDGGFEQADTLRCLKLFVELDNQRKFLAKVAPKAKKTK